MDGVEGEVAPSGSSEDVGRKKSRTKKIMRIILLLVLVAGGGFFLFRWYFFEDPKGPTQAAPIVVDVPKEPVSVESIPSDQPTSSLAPYQSERFRAGEIAIGGEAGLLVPESDPDSLEIRAVRGEAFTEKGKNGAKLVITWETNKPARSEISYGKGAGQAEGIIREEGYGTNHSLVIPDLSQSSTYVYVIASRDKWGNEAESEPYAVYTGAREISLFGLIAGAVGDVFGWAVDK